MKAAIQSRRDALAAREAEAQAQHTEWQRRLHLLEHTISAMQGGLQELDALLALPENDNEAELRQAREEARSWEEVTRNYQEASEEPCADLPSS